MRRSTTTVILCVVLTIAVLIFTYVVNETINERHALHDSRHDADAIKRLQQSITVLEQELDRAEKSRLPEVALAAKSREILSSKKDVVVSTPTARTNALNGAIAARMIPKDMMTTDKSSISTGTVATGGSGGGGGQKNKKKAVIYTMDSIGSYESASLQGGAAGELIIRHSLEYALKHFGVEVDVLRSDEAFDRCKLSQFDFIILDPWTWAAKGWKPKKGLSGKEDKVFILDFFGSQTLRGNSFHVDAKHFLTAYGSPWNTFLGYFMRDHHSGSPRATSKKDQGVVWGKDAKYLIAHEKKLKELSKTVSLYSTSTTQPSALKSSNMHFIGHQNFQGWMALLRESKFLLGLGDPLLGPSAIDAIASGCMFINPIYDTPKRSIFEDQHPYARKLGMPHVCSYKENDIRELHFCVTQALNTTLEPFIPPEMHLENYLGRVKNIFNL